MRKSAIVLHFYSANFLYNGQQYSAARKDMIDISTSRATGTCLNFMFLNKVLIDRWFGISKSVNHISDYGSKCPWGSVIPTVNTMCRKVFMLFIQMRRIHSKLYLNTYMRLSSQPAEMYATRSA